MTNPGDKKLEQLLERAFRGELPNIDAAVLKAGYRKDSRLTVNSVSDLANILEMSDRHVRRLIEAGLPRVKLTGNRFTYDVIDCLKWRHSREIAALEEKLVAKEDLDLLHGPKSPQLERLRRITADHKEFDLEVKHKNFIPLELMRRGLRLLGTMMTRHVEILRRQLDCPNGCGEKARRIMQQLSDEYDRRVEEVCRIEGKEGNEE